MHSVNFFVAAAAVAVPMTNSLCVAAAAMADWHSVDPAPQSTDAVVVAMVDPDLRFAAVSHRVAAAAAEAVEFETFCHCYERLGLVVAFATHFAAIGYVLLESVENSDATYRHQALV